MKTKIVEVTNGPANWGKFLVGMLDDEWQHRSAVDTVSRRPLLSLIGQDPAARLVLDLQTCEGVIVKPGGLAKADLSEHAIWVCPLFEPFLAWFYAHPQHWDVTSLPALVDLPDAPFALKGYRRTRDRAQP